MAIYALPDGRSMEIERIPDRDYWHLRIQGEPNAEIVGTPLGSTLAELLGYEIAHEQWPGWIDELACEVERGRARRPLRDTRARQRSVS
jgi:hypothetical protein